MNTRYSFLLLLFCVTFNAVYTQDVKMLISKNATYATYTAENNYPIIDFSTILKYEINGLNTSNVYTSIQGLTEFSTLTIVKFLIYIITKMLN